MSSRPTSVTSVTPELLLRLQRSDASLEHLRIERATLTPDIVQQLASALRANRCLHTLALTAVSGLTDDALAALAPALAAMPALRSLEVSVTRSFGAAGVGSLADALLGPTNRGLTTLSLRNNLGIDSTALQALARPLRIDRTLRVLDLAMLDFGKGGEAAVAGMRALADALLFNAGLLELNLGQMPLPDSSLAALLDAAEQHSTLWRIVLDDATASSPVRRRAAQLALRRPSTAAAAAPTKPLGVATWAEPVAAALDALASTLPRGSAPPTTATDAQHALVTSACQALAALRLDANRERLAALKNHAGAIAANALADAGLSVAPAASSGDTAHARLEPLCGLLEQRDWLAAQRSIAVLQAEADKVLRPASDASHVDAALTLAGALTVDAMCAVARALCRSALPSTQSPEERATELLDALRDRGALALPTDAVPRRWHVLRWRAALATLPLAKSQLEPHAPACFALASAALDDGVVSRDPQVARSLLAGARTLASVLRSIPGRDAPLPAVQFVSSAGRSAMSAAADAPSSVGDAAPGSALAAAQWTRLKASDRTVKSKALDDLMELTGLERVKCAMLDMFVQSRTEAECGFSTTQRRLHACLVGNPGTGKTTVARLLAALLCELGVLQGSHFVETNGGKLRDLGVNELTRHLDAIRQAKGGVLFVDEAYQLVETMSLEGKKVLDALLDVSETRRDELVIVLAGYKRNMDELLDSNPGLRSRFPTHFVFDDYSDSELVAIFQRSMAKRKGHEPLRIAADVASERAVRTAMRRLGRRRGAPSFGNARDVENALDGVMKRLIARVSRDKLTGSARFALTRNDLLGPAPDEAIRASAALRQLESMTGLERVKRSVRDMIEQVRHNIELEEEEKPPVPFTLHRCFFGNPGTGKTTVAKLYARILTELGLLSKGDVVVVTPKDLIGDVVGASQRNTRKAFDRAAGGVLVIDEAYALYQSASGSGASNSYGHEVIDTLVELIPGDGQPDFAVLMMGYEKEMTRMFKGSNEGLARRFQMENAFRLDDFSDVELMSIMVNQIVERQFEASDEALMVAAEELAKRRGQHGFGNAGDARNLVDRAMAHAISTRGKSCTRLEVDDFRLQTANAADADVDALFADLVGAEPIVAQLRPLKALIAFAQSEGRDAVADGRVPMAFRFVGAPGTGKTTVARRMGRLFASLGVLQRPDVHEHSASDFWTGFVGQASGRTRQLFQDAIGGVLFIDEAYKLCPSRGNSFAAEALEEIVQIMTEPAFRNRLVVVLAGYDADIEELMSANAGLKRRFPTVVQFANLTPTAAATLLEHKLRADNLLLDGEPTRRALQSQLAPRLANAPGFSNAGDVETWAHNVYSEFAQAPNTRRLVSLAHLERAVAPIIADHERKAQQITRSWLGQPVAAAAAAAAAAASRPPPPRTHAASVASAHESHGANARAAASAHNLAHGDDGNGGDPLPQADDISDDPDLAELHKLVERYKQLSTAAFANVDEKFANDDLAPLVAAAAGGEAELLALLNRGALSDDLIRQARDAHHKRTEQNVPDERLGELREKAEAWRAAMLEAQRLKEEQEEKRRELEDKVKREAEEAAWRAELEKTDAARKAAEAAAAKAAKHGRLEPIWICGACSRPWGLCTYMGPIFAGVRWVPA